MRKTPASIAYLNASRLQRGLLAGIQNVLEHKDILNKINVFPVPDADTGTNLAFTLKTIMDVLIRSNSERVDELLVAVADAALDGARGNSGAIMAQFFQGIRESVEGYRLLTAEGLAIAASVGSEAAWKAMSEPVAGTLPTVLNDFADELKQQVARGVDDLGELLQLGLQRAQVSLANTPNLLPALKEAGVVDAGAQGFVDLLEGIWSFIRSGKLELDPVLLNDFEESPVEQIDFNDATHRYCTECMISHAGTGDGLQRDAIMAALQELDSSSLVVAGTTHRVRVHIHTDKPAEVFMVCEGFGQISRQKADDMQMQHARISSAAKVAIVVDSGADISDAELERLGIHVVPVRLSFGDRDYMDGTTLSSEEFYRMLPEAEDYPKTSQPPAGDFRRQYELLTSHGHEVVSVGLSARLSGTTEAARSAASRLASDQVSVFDTANASCGQGLLASLAAEAAAAGYQRDEIVSLLTEAMQHTRTWALADDLSWGVRGGRVPKAFYWLTRILRVNPMLKNTPDGRLSLGGVVFGRGIQPEKFARKVTRQLDSDLLYRLTVAHANNPEAAAAVKQALLKNHPRIHSCTTTEAGPALGVHLGPGGVIVGAQRYVAVENR